MKGLKSCPLRVRQAVVLTLCITHQIESLKFGNTPDGGGRRQVANRGRGSIKTAAELRKLVLTTHLLFRAAPLVRKTRGSLSAHSCYISSTMPAATSGQECRVQLIDFHVDVLDFAEKRFAFCISPIGGKCRLHVMNTRIILRVNQSSRHRTLKSSR